MRINIYPIQKIPVNFNVEDPYQKNKGYIEAFGNYDCYLYQYVFYQDIAVAQISKDHEHYNIPKDEELELCEESPKVGKDQNKRNLRKLIRELCLKESSSVEVILDKNRNKLDLRKPIKNMKNVIAEQSCERLYMINNKISKFISFNELFLLAKQTYTKELAPYAQGVERNRAEELVKKLIQSFLNSETDKCVYIEFPPVRSHSFSKSHVQVKPVSRAYYLLDLEPLVIKNRFGILDPINKEFFELILGGTD